jgi:NAD(P)-dependent dehydrogenase (short-subunit alcohol dehydrogenase family)
MSAQHDLKGRVALVTGAAQGIGAAIATALAEAGAKVVIGDLADGQEAAASIGGAYTRLDVTSEADWPAAVAFAKSTFGGLDILVNNAGIFWVRPLAMQSLADFRKMQQVNVEGVFLGLKHCIPAIAERSKQWKGGGSIINVSSVAGLVGSPNLIAYNASKGAVRLMSKSAALECAEQGLNIRVNSVHPGIIDTAMMRGMVDQLVAIGAEKTEEAARARFARRHPLNRVGQATDIANAVVFLAGDASGFMTGSEVVIDGGMTAT